MNILCISDLHIPYHHPKALAFLADVARRYRPDRVVCLGDEVDAYAYSRFTKDPDAPSAGDELEKAVTVLRQLFELFPQVLVCESNHLHRPYKRACEAGLPAAFLRQVRQVLKAPPGWRWAPHWRVGPMLFLHGEGFSGKNGALTAAQAYRRSVVLGHIHAFAGVQWQTSLEGSIFGMNCGCLVDPTAVAFAYARHLANRPTLGCGVILDGVPHFEPLRS